MTEDDANYQRKIEELERENSVLKEKLKQKELSLQKNKKSEELFKKMFEYHEAVMLLIAYDTGAIIDANLSAEKFYGYSKTQLCSMLISEINALAVKDIEVKRLQAFKNSDNHFVFPHKLANGSIRIVEVHSSPVDFQGKSVLFSVIHDITDRKKAENSLKENEEKFRSLAENTADGLVVFNAAGAIEYLSPAYTKIFGYTEKDILHKKAQDIADIIHPDDRAPVMQSLQEAKLEKKEILTYEYRAKHQKGHYMWRRESIKFVYDINKQLKKSYVLCSDITERKKAEQDLKESEVRWKFALEGAKDGVWDWNLSTNEVYFSPQWKAMLGFKEHEIQGSLDEWTKRVHPHDLEKCYADIQAHLDDKTSVYSNIHRVLCKNGEYKWILDRGKIVLKDNNGDATRMIGTHTDLTERIKTEQQLIQINADKDRFISILAHDLKSPFNSILGFLDLILLNLDKYDTNKIESHLNIINNSAKNTYKLLNDLLTWGRSNTGTIPFDPQWLKFLPLCNEVIENLSLSAETKNIKISLCAIEELSIYGDKSMINTILRNLISNAIKFTNKFGQVNVYATVDKANITVTVSDNGIGIKPQTINKLFDIKEKFSEKGTEKESGTGLGLLLCKDFVEKHKGKIWVNSKLGKGSDFKFSLPIPATSKENTQTDLAIP